MRPKVILNQIRSFNDLFDDTTLFLKQNWRPLTGACFYVCGYPLLAVIAVYGFEQVQSVYHLRWGDYTFGLTYFIRIALTVINLVLLNLTVLSFMLLYTEKNNEAPEKTEVYHYVKYYFVRLLTAHVLLGFGLAILFILGGFPGVYFWPVALLIMTIMVLENADLGYAFNSAFRLIKGRWWRTAGAIFLNMLLVWSICMLLTIPLSILAGGIILLSGVPFQSVMEIIPYLSFLAYQFIGVLSPIVMALIYYDLNERHGDQHLLQRIAMLGGKNARVDHLHAEDY